jgi:hypothetical protein
MDRPILTFPSHGLGGERDVPSKVFHRGTDH